MITKLLADINTFLSGLSDVGKKLLAGAIILIVIALFDRLLIGPTMTKLSSIDAEINTEERDIKQDLKFLNYKERIVKEHDDVAPFFTKDIPTEEELISAFLKRLEGIAAEAKVTVGKVSPGVGVSDADYLRYQADLECTGKLTDIVSFMHIINTSNELLKVTKYTLSGKKADADDNIKATMTVEKAIVIPTNEKPKPASPKDAPTST